MVRKYKIHTDLDSNDNVTFDLTSGKIRFYNPSNLGMTMNSNVWSGNGIGVIGDQTIGHSDLEFQLETFGGSLEENYKIFNTFINAMLKEKYVTLEYTNSLGTFYADMTLNNVTKTEGFGFNGTFSETISFTPLSMWYVYESLTFSVLENGELTDSSKIYSKSRYTYDGYTYSKEDNIDRFSKWEIQEGIFSFVAKLTPSETTNGGQYGLKFLDSYFNEYTAVIVNSSVKPDYIQINTDVNDEYYNATIGESTINVFEALDFQRFRTRIFQKGSMELVNLSEVEIHVKRKVEFV